MATLGNTPRPAYVYDTETDTWVPIGVPSHNHDSNYVNQTTFDAKGDLIVGTGDNSYNRLEKGSDGTVLVSDSSTATGLRWQGNFAAGKNKIINGDFNINQRAFTSITTSATYTFDRWRSSRSGGTTTYSAQTFSLGAAPVAGYEGKNFLRIDTTGQTTTNAYSRIDQRIESVRTFAGQTVTVSFWAKAASGTPNIAISYGQNFGTGGSPSTAVEANISKLQISTSWVRYSASFAVPSISGKTLGTDVNDFLSILLWVSAGSDYNSETNSLGIQTNTFDIWGVQVEAGSVATAFQTATGTIQGELAACQRYYQRFNASTSASAFALGSAYSTTAVQFIQYFGIPFRTTPSTTLDYSGLRAQDIGTGAYSTFTGVSISGTPSAHSVQILLTGSTGLTQYRPYMVAAAASTDYFGLSAEL